jgi:AraC-like DNA-binding protein
MSASSPSRRRRQTSEAVVELTRIPSELLAPAIAADFARLRISVSFLAHGVWRALELVPNITTYEVEHGGWPSRHLYNARSLERVESEKRSVLGEHAGFFDLFVPVLKEGSVDAVLVAGPFARTRPRSAEVLERWHRITNSQGRLADPSFFRYLEATLATVTFEGTLFETFERLLSCFARVVGEKGPRAQLAAEAAALQSKLDEATLADRMWDAARDMVGRLTHIGSTPLLVDPLASFGLERAPGHVVVGLLRERGVERDPVDAILRGDAMQRACVTLARRRGRMISGRIGSHGVTFLLDARDSGTRLRAVLLDVVSRANVLARRFGFSFHAGLSRTEGAASLAARYGEALGAAEKALSQGDSVAYSEERPERWARHLRELRAKLGQSVGEQPGLLSARFERYVEAALLHSGYHIDTVRRQLEAGLERLIEPLSKAGALDAKTVDDMWSSAERAVDGATTIVDVVSPYRQLVMDIEHALRSATPARHDRGARRALAFVRDHLGEPMTLVDVARVAGFAPAYFSKLLKRREGVSFEHFVRRLRIERAKQMLSDTPFGAERIAQLCGFGNRTYFHRAFKQVVGMTPNAYRTVERR